jgi:hypothetical protein
MLYRKKPITVKAVQWSLGKVVEGVHRIPANKVDLSKTRGIIVDRPERYVVNTLEGQMEVTEGDWIVTGIKGEIYPVKDAIFKLTYEPVTKCHGFWSRLFGGK